MIDPIEVAMLAIDMFVARLAPSEDDETPGEAVEIPDERATWAQNVVHDELLDDSADAAGFAAALDRRRRELPRGRH